MGEFSLRRVRSDRRSVIVALAALALCAFAVTIAPAGPVSAAEPAAEGYGVEVVATGLVAPTNVEIAPDGRVFVAEKRGRIHTFDSLEDSSPTLSIDLSHQVHDFEDRGLLGLAVDPGFPTEPYVYAMFAYDEGNSWQDTCPTPPGTFVDGCVVDGRLVRYPVNAQGVATTAPTVLVENLWCAQFPSHTVGDLQFLADGTLVATAGDGADYNSVDFGQNGGSPGSPTPRNPCGDAPGGVGGVMEPPTAQGGALRSQALLTSTPTTYSGSVIRIDPDTGLAPADNPLVGDGDPEVERIIAHGLRNPFRITDRPGTNEIWVGDVGWGTYEEINRIDLDGAGAGVPNFGWPCYEGPNLQSAYAGVGLDVCTGLYDGTLGTGIDEPAFFYQHGNAPDPARCGAFSGASVSAVEFIEPNSYPASLHGGLVFGDYARSCLWTMELGPDGEPDPSTIQTLLTDIFVVDVEQAPDGDLVVVDILRGQIEKISYFGVDVPPTAGIAVDVDNGPLPLEVTFDGTASADPEGGVLTYDWDLDGDGIFGDADQAIVTYTYTDPGTVTAQLRVTDAGGQDDVAQIDVYPGNTRPVVTITSPDIASWDVGDEIPFAATVSDAEDGVIDGSDIQWLIELMHCAEPEDCHVHILETPSGVASGSFTAPDHEYPSWLMLTAWVADSQGLVGRTSVELQPRVFDVQVESGELTGVEVSIGSETDFTPFTRTVLANSNLVMSSPATQVIGGQNYFWQGWSIGGPRVQDVVFTEPTTISALFGTEPALSGEVAVSDLDWTGSVNGWGPVERDTSNGEEAPGDGGPLAIDGVTFARGIGSHADFALTLGLNGECTRFTSTVGINDAQGSLGSVRYYLDGDGTQLHASPLLTGDSPAHLIDVDITGVDQLTLSVDNGGDNPWFDHADWAEPTLTCGTSNPDPTPTPTPTPDPDPTPTPTPPALSGEVAVSDLDWTGSVNGWGPVERDTSNGEEAPGDGGPLAIDGVTFARGIGSHADFALTLGLNGECTRFTSTVGINDAQGSLGSVRYYLDGDGTQLHASPLLTGDSPAHLIDVDITGVDQLTLSVDNGGDNPWFDHADWAEPTLTCGTSNPDPTPTPTPTPDPDPTPTPDPDPTPTPDPDPTPTPEPTPTPPALSGEVAVSDLDWTGSVNGWGPVERDTSNGEEAPGDGGPLAIDGVTFARGIGSHADFALTLGLNGECTRFTSTVGINDAQGSLGSVRYYLDGDGTQLHASPLLTGDSPAHLIDVDITGVDQLTLSVDNGGDNPWFDHADWAEPTLTCGTSNPDPTPTPTPTPDPDPTPTPDPDPTPTPEPDPDPTPTPEPTPTPDPDPTPTPEPTPTPDPDPTPTPDPSLLSIATGTFSHSVLVEDLNSDGNPDVIAAASGDDAVAVALGQGGGQFATPVQLSTGPGSFPKYADVFDIDGDGNLDLVTANQDTTVDHDVSVFFRDAGGIYGAPLQLAACSRAHQVASGDVTGDGIVDLVVACWGGTVVSVLEGLGSRTFAAPVDIEVGDAPHSLVLGDFDGNGTLDLAVGAFGDNRVAVLLNQGDGSFGSPALLWGGLGPHNIQAVDLDADGALDLVVTAQNQDELGVLLGNGDGTFQGASFYAVGPVPKAAAAADVNGDGVIDLVSANTHGNYPSGSAPTSVSLLLGNGDGTFGGATPIPVDLTPFSVAVADIDGDGATDIVVANWHSNDTKVLFGPF